MSSDPRSELVLPDIENLFRLFQDIVAVLSQLPFIRRIAIFGSFAEDRADRWSDIDIMAACDDPERDAWAAASAIRAAKPVLYYRKFNSAEPPTGRYWFVGESVFHRLDVSFLSTKVYEQYIDKPELLGHAITLQEIYSADSGDCCIDAIDVATCPVEVSEFETQIGVYIYFSIRAIKHQLREGRMLERDVPRIVGLQNALPELPRDAVMTGGSIGELAHQVYEMLELLQLLPQPSNHPTI